eukprot:GHVS01007939.1.p1 GENE.GHVS01007939.1~~GHVS01007939.1.p1  ORF type:complete len:158 (-),score=39.21 GHVS01007939.1:49-522(-)
MAGISSEVDETLRGWISENPSITGYIVLNADGIPVKHHEDVPYNKAVQYAALISDLCAKSSKYLRELLSADNELSVLRLRTSDGGEVIVMSAVDYTLIVLQNCSNNNKGKTTDPTNATNSNTASASGSNAQQQQQDDNNPNASASTSTDYNNATKYH